MGGSPDVDTSYQDFSRQEAERTRAEEAARQARIREGMAGIERVFSGTQPILDQRRKAMEDFYLPQLDKKRDDGMRELTFALSRAGLLNSDTAGRRQATLGEDYSLEKAGILSDIDADVAGAKTGLNQQRASIEASLRSSGDATAATNQALSTTTTFRDDAPELNPLGDLFYGIAAGIGAQKQGEAVGKVRRTATPSPLNAGSGRNVGG
jgi:hypothetical protein